MLHGARHTFMISGEPRIVELGGGGYHSDRLACGALTSLCVQVRNLADDAVVILCAPLLRL
jgi:hypothetical protein